MALSKDEIIQRLQVPEWRAWLDVIAFCEGADYNILYSGKTFDSFTDHPNRVICSGNYCSSAAGRYQIMDFTWYGKDGRPGLKQNVPLSDFSPNNQDIAAIYLIANQRGVPINLIEENAPNFNNFDNASGRLASEWCSLPGTNRGACEGQPKKSLQTAYNFYVQALAWRRGQGPEPSGLRNQGEGQGNVEGGFQGFTNPLFRGLGSLFGGLTNISEDYCADIRPLTYIDAKSFPGCDSRIEINFFSGPPGVGAAANPLIGDTNVTNPAIPDFINVEPSAAYGQFALPMSKNNYKVTSNYGPRQGRLHEGIDLSAPVGTPTASIADGEVVFAGWGGNYGNVVIIKHTNGYYSLNAHLSKILTEIGAPVKQSQVIGQTGSTGNSTGPHLHLEIGRSYKGGADIQGTDDPRRFLQF